MAISEPKISFEVSTSLAGQLHLYINSVHQPEFCPECIAPGFFESLRLSPSKMSKSSPISEAARDELYETLLTPTSKLIDEETHYYLLAFSHSKGFGNTYFKSKGSLDIREAEDIIRQRNRNIDQIVVLVINKIDESQYRD